MPAQSVDIQVVRGRYQLLEQLGEGSMGRVFRAYDRLSGETVALKRVSGPFTIEPHLSSTVDDLPNTEPQVALAREFQSLASLRHPNIIGVRDYGFADGAPYFTMEFLEDAQNLLEAGRHRSLGDKIGLLVQMLQALVYLHRRDIVHRDLKPGNVLLAAERVRVLDFGLSVRTSEARGTVGTLNYMAPEVLYGQPAGPASDFYAVGVLAYQLLVGEHPFHRRPPGGSLIKRILTEEPDLGRPEIPPPLRPILGRLLAKQPAERFPRAADVIAAFSAATGVAYPPETEATRESLLQAASFVGRDRELGMLKRSLRQALDGHGEAWLIGGESGVGKSRLLDELRIHALVRGALVLRSQATRGGRPYRLWRPILRRLLLETEVNNLEASVLKAVVPDLDELIERPVADAPPLKPQATQARLLTALSNLIVRRSRRRPVVLIVEDLHWASGESLDLLRELASDVAALPLLLVGDYRDDERPELAEELRGLRHLKLGRLPRRAIRELSESMIGPAGRRQSVLNLLQRETEGNPLFLIEVVRALAEEAGELERIGSTTLPKSVFTGGLQRLVERRLSRVPAEAVAALQTSAVAGRQINLPMLREAYPDLDVDLWITTCANIAVLTTADERWGFAHQRLRDGVLAQLNEARLRQVHAQVAAALERAYPEPAEQADSLAYHWYQSGERPEKVVTFGQKAGDRALSLGAYSDARRQYERVVESLERMAPSPEHQALLIDIILKLARMAAFLPGENIPHLLQRALEVAETLGDRPRQASVLGSIGA